jgi:hypothetical protein
MLFTATAPNFVIRHSDLPQVAERVLFVLSEVSPIEFLPVNSEASVEAKLTDRLLNMLEDSSTSELHQLYIIRIISDLSRHESTAVAIAEANILNFVQKLLRSRSTDLYQHIFLVLENLAFHESTAMAVVRTLPLDLLGTRWWHVFIDLHISSEIDNLIQ